MADAIPITCAKCNKAMTVPAKLAGKKVKCKGCDAIVAVPGAKETFKFADDEPAARSTKPVKKAKAVATPAPASPPPVDDEDENNPNPYGAIEDNSHIPRCAFCAQEMDPPDARICKGCGYDMQERRRHESKAVYENSIGDYLTHHGTTIGAALFIIALIVIDVIFFMNMADWFEGSWMVQEDKDQVTGKPKYWIPPGLVLTWATIMFLGMGWYALRYIIRKLKDFHPRETLTAE